MSDLERQIAALRHFSQTPGVRAAIRRFEIRLLEQIWDLADAALEPQEGGR